ncbi:caspase family protein [Nocardia sp. NPDC004722]
MRLPDPVRSRALLLGTSRYSDPGLPNLPAVRNNLNALAEIFTSPWATALAPEHCVPLPDESNRGVIGAALNDAAGQAEDLLLVYYAGHGLIGADGGLYLSMPDTRGEPDMVSWTALPFELLRSRLAHAHAANRVLILDCCFSGLAIDLMADVSSVVSGQLTVAGACTLTSSPANRPSMAPTTAEYTAYTGELLKLLRNGPTDAGAELLTLTAIHEHLARVLPAKGFPRPEQRNTRTIGHLALSGRPPRSGSGHAEPFGDAPDPITPDSTPLPPERVIEAGPGWSWVRVDSPWSSQILLRHKAALNWTTSFGPEDQRFAVHATADEAYDDLAEWIATRESTNSDRRELLEHLRQVNRSRQLIACCSHEEVSPDVNPNFAPPAVVYCVYHVHGNTNAQSAGWNFFMDWRRTMVEVSPRSGRCIWHGKLSEGWNLHTVPLI